VADAAKGAQPGERAHPPLGALKRAVGGS
jgi:hypothetical protein